MLFTTMHAKSFAAVCFVAALAGCGTTPELPSDLTQQVRIAQATLANFQNDPEMRAFRSYMGTAKAVVISPRVTKAGFIVGGSGGEALVLARDKSGQWLGPAFYNMGAGSVGLQIGVEVSEVIIVVMTDKALNALLSRSFRLGGDASIAAGPVGVGTASTPSADMISFARSKGAFAGLSFDGAVIAPDSGANIAFYGQAASPVDILVRASVNNPAAAPLQQALRQMPR